MSRPSGGLILACVATVVVAAAVVGGLVVLGPPSEERARRLDERRSQELRNLTGAVDVYWGRHRRLPATLEELEGEPGIQVVARDPATGQAYEYRALGEKDYELCARFERGSPEDRTDTWAHTAGRQCYPLQISELPHH